MTKEKRIFQQLTSSDICEIYSLLHSEGLIHFPLTRDARGKIDAAVANITGSNFGYENYKSVPEKAVAYLYFLIKNHPFTDGNKRTAVLVFLVLVRKNDLTLSLEGYGLDALAVFIERLQVQNHQEVISFIAKEILR